MTMLIMNKNLMLYVMYQQESIQQVNNKLACATLPCVLYAILYIMHVVDDSTI